MLRRKNVRLPNYDYRLDGFYFVTIVTARREPTLSKITKELKRLLEETATAAGRSYVDTVIIMPDHIHCIIVLRQSPFALGELIRRFKAKSSRLFERSIWQANYYEHVIRNELALNRIRAYIQHNPELELRKFDQFYTQSSGR